MLFSVKISSAWKKKSCKEKGIFPKYGDTVTLNTPPHQPSKGLSGCTLQVQKRQNLLHNLNKQRLDKTLNPWIKLRKKNPLIENDYQGCI